MDRHTLLSVLGPLSKCLFKDVQLFTYLSTERVCQEGRCGSFFYDITPSTPGSVAFSCHVEHMSLQSALCYIKIEQNKILKMHLTSILTCNAAENACITQVEGKRQLLPGRFVSTSLYVPSQLPLQLQSPCTAPAVSTHGPANRIQRHVSNPSAETPDKGSLTGMTGKDHLRHHLNSFYSAFFSLPLLQQHTETTNNFLFRYCQL